MLKNTPIRENDTINQDTAKIASFLRVRGANTSLLCFALDYAAFISAENDIDDVDGLLNYIENEISEERAMFIKQVAGENLSIAIQLSKEFGSKAILEFLRSFSHETIGKLGEDLGTPESLSKLALKILDVSEEEYLADFGSGSGDFIVFSAGNSNSKAIYGIEINTWVYEVSRIRTELFTENVTIELGDMFALSNEKKFDKIFSNYPFGLRQLHLQAGAEYIDALHKRVPDIKKATSSDWIFNSLIIDHLTDNGKAVAIMTNGSTWNSIDQKVREYFIRNGFIEAVIALPARLFEYSNIPTTMIVLSKNNKIIRLVDATDLYEQGRRQNALTQEHLDEIIRLLGNDDENSKCIGFDVLSENNYVINPSRYLEKTVKIEDGVKFGNIMKRITRGAPLRASDLDSMVSEDPTDTQYLMLANIQNGMISDNLSYLKELDPKLEKYCINNRNLLLSKNGAPFKVAVAEVEYGRKLLGNGNLFIIELDEEKVNPYFIKAFFDSEAGTAVLKTISVGATLPNISAESLKNLIVPLPPLEKQNEIANLYQAKQDEIRVLELRLQKAQNELKGIFGEVN